MGTGGVFSQG